MSQPIIQTSFNAGEWAPALNARVDLKQYHSGAALLRNFFVDYRGGATTRPGTKYILQTRTVGARLIPFQASFAVTYLLEFGAGYIRFFQNGSPVLENATSLTAAVVGSPTIFTDNAHGYVNGDWLFTQNNYYIVNVATANTFTLVDLFGASINTNPFTLPAAPQRVYQIPSNFITSELFQIKYCQEVNLLFLCHPNHPPQVLTLNSATNWTLTPVTFTPTIATPSGISSTSNAGAGTNATAYVVTAVDINGQESLPAGPTTISSKSLIGVSWTNTISWSSVIGAVSYNVYRTILSGTNVIPGGSQYGFVGNLTGLSFIDTTIGPNFAVTPPIVNNPFAGAGVQTITITNGGLGFTSVPVTTIDPPPPGGVQAQAFATCQAGTSVLTAGGSGYSASSVYNTNFGGVLFTVATTDPFGSITSGFISGRGSVIYPAILPGSLSIIGGGGSGATFNVQWDLQSLTLTNPGAGYLIAPAVHFTGGGPGGGAAVTTLGASSAGNPTVPGFFQQRLFLGGPPGSPSQLNLSQPGSPFNFNISDPTQPDDAIQETLTNTSLNSIKSVITVAAGLVIFTDKSAWLVNGGSAGSPISALDIVANAQSYSGASDLPPITTSQDVLYVQAKGSIVRDLSYNFYIASYVGADISILSSHLFYGFSLIQWAWAEEPFKLVWAVRNDGTLLTLTFIKEQELIAWAHHDTQGLYTSVATITEATSIGNSDAIYVIAQRTVQGAVVQYIERMTELNYPQDYISSWQVDAGIGYSGTPATTFSGANHLSGLACTGVADGAVINFTMPVGGTFVFGPGGTVGLTAIPNASVVTVGLAFTPQLQTLALDLGEPTVQGKRKKVAAVTSRVRNALGLSAGRTLTTLQPMQDLILGNVGTMSNVPVTGLQTTDARMYVDPQWDVFGQYYITQPNPYPASILGVIPEIEVGDA